MLSRLAALSQLSGRAGLARHRAPLSPAEGNTPGGMAAMNPIKPATPKAIDNATGKTRARHDAMPNEARSANSTTVTSHALTRSFLSGPRSTSPV